MLIVNVSPDIAVDISPAPAIVKVSVVILAAVAPESPATVSHRF